MANKSLTFDIFGRDKTASKSLTGVQKAAQRAGKAMKAAGRIAGIGLAAAGLAAVKFGSDSVKAFAAAEKSDNELQFALKKFPKTADTNIKALKKLNTELMKKSRFDDDAIASGEALLAQYELTGDQIMELMPLIVDYAAKTGKDIPSASKAIGKALMGQGRALKEVGINFKDTGSLAGNFDSIVGSLSKQVGGFAATDLQTANGKLENMRNRFGEVQEKVGEALMPTLEKLMDYAESDLIPGLEAFSTWFTETGGPALEGFIDWVKTWKDELVLAAGAIGVATGAQWLLNAALLANPIGAVTALIVLYIAALVYAGTHMKDFGLLWDNVVFNMKKGAVDAVLGVATFAQGLVNNILFMINSIIGPINGLLATLNMPLISLPGSVQFTGALQAASNSMKGKKVGGGGGGGKPPTALAEGGIVRSRPGGIFANIGEGRHDEAVIPLTNGVLSKMGGGGGTTIINVTGYVGDENKLGREITRVLNNSRKRGAIA